jgi:hypothetical protein
VRPEDVGFDASVLVDGVEEHVGETIAEYASWAVRKCRSAN